MKAFLFLILNFLFSNIDPQQYHWILAFMFTKYFEFLKFWCRISSVALSWREHTGFFYFLEMLSGLFYSFEVQWMINCLLYKNVYLTSLLDFNHYSNNFEFTQAFIQILDFQFFLDLIIYS